MKHRADTCGRCAEWCEWCGWCGLTVCVAVEASSTAAPIVKGRSKRRPACPDRGGWLIKARRVLLPVEWLPFLTAFKEFHQYECTTPTAKTFARSAATRSIISSGK